MYILCTYMCISCTHYVDQVPLGEHSVQAEANLLLELNERGGHGGRISQPGPKREQVLRAPRGVGWKLQNPASDRTRSSCRSSCNLRRRRDKSHSLRQSQLTHNQSQTRNERCTSRQQECNNQQNKMRTFPDEDVDCLLRLVCPRLRERSRERERERECEREREGEREAARLRRGLPLASGLAMSGLVCVCVCVCVCVFVCALLLIVETEEEFISN